MIDTALIWRLEDFAKSYEDPEYYASIEGTPELLREAARALKEAKEELERPRPSLAVPGVPRDRIQRLFSEVKVDDTIGPTPMNHIIAMLTENLSQCLRDHHELMGITSSHDPLTDTTRYRAEIHVVAPREGSPVRIRFQHPCFSQEPLMPADRTFRAIDTDLMERLFGRLPPYAPYQHPDDTAQQGREE